MTPLLDTDLIRVNRGGVDYQATWAEVKAGVPASSSPSWSLDIDTADTSWTLHVNSTCTVDVDWGDGNSELLVLSGFTSTTHTYAAPGQYTIGLLLVSGEFRPFFNDTGEKELIAINETGEGWSFGETLDKAFYKEENLAVVSPLMDISSVTNLTSAWNQAYLSDFPLLNTSAVTTFSSTWRLNNFTDFPLIDTSSAINLNAAWRQCKLVSFPAINTSSVTDMTNCWYNNDLTNFPLIDTSSVVTMTLAWANNNLTSFPAIDTSSVGVMAAAWKSNPNLVTFPALTLSSVTNLAAAWEGCNLDAASIENLTQSFIASGKTNLSTTINGAIYPSGWTAQAQADYTELTNNRGWTITTS